MPALTDTEIARYVDLTMAHSSRLIRYGDGEAAERARRADFARSNPDVAREILARLTVELEEH